LLNPLTRLDPSLTQVPAVEINQVYLLGTKTGLKSGDRLLLVGTQAGMDLTQPRIVRNVKPDDNKKQTLIEFEDDAPLPSFAPLSPPFADLRVQNIPFTQDNVNTYILGNSISESDL
jgi:hypothetical protein